MTVSAWIFQQRIKRVKHSAVVLASGVRLQRASGDTSSHITDQIDIEQFIHIHKYACSL